MGRCWFVLSLVAALITRSAMPQYDDSRAGTAVVVSALANATTSPFFISLSGLVGGVLYRVAPFCENEVVRDAVSVRARDMLLASSGNGRL